LQVGERGLHPGDGLFHQLRRNAKLNRSNISPPGPKAGPGFTPILATSRTRWVISSRVIPVPEKSTQARKVDCSGMDQSPGMALMPSSKIFRLPSR
jgi:hypothetical protein